MFAQTARTLSTLHKLNFYSSSAYNHIPRLQERGLARSLRAMATGSKVHLEASQKPQFYVKGLKAESAEKASQLLQVNHEKHHIFFNQSGFHVRHVSDINICQGLPVHLEPHRPSSPHSIRAQRFARRTPKSIRRKCILSTPIGTAGKGNRQ